MHRVRQKRQAVHHTDRPVNLVEVRMVVHTLVEVGDVRGVSGESGVAVGGAASEAAPDCLPEDARSWWGYCSYQYFHQVAHELLHLFAELFVSSVLLVAVSVYYDTSCSYSVACAAVIRLFVLHLFSCLYCSHSALYAALIRLCLLQLFASRPEAFAAVDWSDFGAFSLSRCVSPRCFIPLCIQLCMSTATIYTQGASTTQMYTKQETDRCHGHVQD